MDKLVEAAKAEGQLNVIALPPDWANYGAIIKAFEEKYDIKVNSAQPDAASQDEINAANQQKGKSTAPDVFDLGQSVALANTAMFAPYKVATWDDIPSAYQDPDGKWVNDYGGYMSIGFDSAKVPPVTGVADLLKPEYRGGSRSTGIRPRPARRSPACSWWHWRRADPPTTSLPASNSSPSSSKRAISCPSTRPRRPSSPARPRWSSTGTTPTPRRPRSCRAGRCWCRRTPQSPVTTTRRSTRTRRIRGRAAVAGVPVQRRRPEPLRGRRRSSRPRRQHGGRRQARQGRGRLHADRARSGHSPQPEADRGGHQVSGGQLGEGDRLSRSMPGHSVARRVRDALPLLPFVAVVTVFLIVPTVTVIVMAFFADGSFSLARIAHCSQVPRCRHWAERGALGEHRGARGGFRRGAVLVDREQPAVVDAAPVGARAVQRAGPVRRRGIGIRVPRDRRPQRRADAVGAGAPRVEPGRFGLAVWPARPDPGVHLLSDPAHGDRVHPRAGVACASSGARPR